VVGGVSTGVVGVGSGLGDGSADAPGDSDGVGSVDGVALGVGLAVGSGVGVGLGLGAGEQPATPLPATTVVDGLGKAWSADGSEPSAGNSCAASARIPATSGIWMEPRTS
jgi:hypothetical protein